MRKIVLMFGLISGIVLSAMMLATLPLHDHISFETGAVIGYTTMVAASLLIYFGVRRYRDTVGGGRVSFARALAVGVLIVAMSSACYVATWEAIYFELDPGFGARYQARLLEREQQRGATPVQLAAKKMELDRFAERYRNPAFNAAITFLEPLPVGLLMALVSAAMLRRRAERNGTTELAETT